MVKNGRGGNISLLDDEVLVEILCRLGAFKYSVPCKSVCKFWCSVMDTSSSDSYFMSRWRQMNNKEEGTVLVTQYAYLNALTFDYRHSIDCNTKEFSSLYLNFMPSDGPICILGTSKDLLLCCPFPYDHSLYYLCNPFTKQWTTLPPPPTQGKEVRITADIKVDLIVYDNDHGRGMNWTVLRIDPYTLEGGRVRKGNIFVFSSDDSGGGWRQMEGESRISMLVSRFGYYSGQRLRFKPDTFHVHLAGGQSTRFVFPPDPEQDIMHSEFGVCRGLLRVAELVGRPDPRKLVVWQLNDSEKQEWDMVQELGIKEMVEGLKDCRMIRGYYGRERGGVEILVLGFHPHDGDILYLSFRPRSKKKARMYIFLCHLKKRRLELVRTFITSHIENGLPPSWPRSSFFTLAPPCWPTPVPCLQP